jgi:methylglutamate dehydrogenase subunit B
VRIPCPNCGERDTLEFTYLGAAGSTRPDPDDPDAARKFIEYVYLRDNPAGLHREWWFHAAGCQGWLLVERNTLTHEISSAVRADAADRA